MFMSECKYRVNIVYVYIMDLCTSLVVFCFKFCLLVLFPLGFHPLPCTRDRLLHVCCHVFLSFLLSYIFHCVTVPARHVQPVVHGSRASQHSCEL